mgnify:CR=1 FL=1
MMFWQFRKLTYDILIPPLGKSIYQLSEQAAADYFAWCHTELHALQAIKIFFKDFNWNSV